MSTQLTQVPSANSNAAAHSARLEALLKHEIQINGPLSFARFMQQALYAPGLGYYSAGAQKFGKEGDFTTAVEMSALYSRCIAKQCQQILDEAPGDIVECGAGTGRMALTLLLELEASHSLPNRYYILEISADLKQRQQQLIKAHAPHLLDKVTWLETLNDLTIEGIVLGNEVIDAFPVHLFKYKGGQFYEIYVRLKENKFDVELGRPGQLLAQYLNGLDIQFPEEYESECNLHLFSWINSMSQLLRKGVVLLIDYGFPRHEYYHPDRNRGTLMCHYQHRAHSDPFLNIGLQDITAHVDFTAVAEAARAASLEVAGFTNQANFLLSCGMINLLEEGPQAKRMDVVNEIKILTSPNEMGELFKAIALTKNWHLPLLGFAQRNMCAKLE